METRVSVPDRTDPIVAWRVWGITDHPDAPLVSVTQPTYRWAPNRRMEAVCICRGQERAYSDREAIVNHCCGLHGAQEMRDAVGYWTQPGANYPHGSVLGQVSLWGRVTVHENGVYRAEFAYPKTFAFDPQQGLVRQFLVEGLARLYGVGTTFVEWPWPMVANECPCAACQMHKNSAWGSQFPQPAPMPPFQTQPPMAPNIQIQPYPNIQIAPNPNIIIQPSPGWTGNYMWTVVGNQPGGV